MANSDTSLTQYTPDDFLDQPVGRKHDGRIGLRIRRSILIAFICSLLLHSFLVLKVIQFDEPDQSNPFDKSDTIVVTLAPPPTAEKPKEAEPQKAQKKQPKKKKVVKKKKKATKKKPIIIPKKAKPTPVTPKQEEAPLPKEVVKPQPIEQTEPAPTDMAEYVRQQQAKRQAQESAAARENAIAIAKLKGPSKEDLRNQRIKENLTEGGTSLFSIGIIDDLGASFSFNGWQANARKEHFYVPNQQSEDIRLLIVRRVIQRIRQDFNAEFNWVSHRLNKTIVLSARLEDNEGLEHFLMQEFFGEHYDR